MTDGCLRGILNANPPKACLPGKGMSCPQLVRVAARSSRAGSGRPSCCGRDRVSTWCDCGLQDEEHVSVETTGRPARWSL